MPVPANVGLSSRGQHDAHSAESVVRAAQGARQDLVPASIAGVSDDSIIHGRHVSVASLPRSAATEFRNTSVSCAPVHHPRRTTSNAQHGVSATACDVANTMCRTNILHFVVLSRGLRVAGGTCGRGTRPGTTHPCRKICSSRRYNIVTTLVFVAVACGAADDTVDTEIKVAGSYPGQPEIAVQAFASRSLGGASAVANTSVPLVTPSASPLSFEQQVRSCT